VLPDPRDSSHAIIAFHYLARQRRVTARRLIAPPRNRRPDAGSDKAAAANYAARASPFSILASRFRKIHARARAGRAEPSRAEPIGCLSNSRIYIPPVYRNARLEARIVPRRKNPGSRSRDCSARILDIRSRLSATRAQRFSSSPLHGERYASVLLSAEMRDAVKTCSQVRLPSVSENRKTLIAFFGAQQRPPGSPKALDSERWLFRCVHFLRFPP